MLALYIAETVRSDLEFGNAIWVNENHPESCPYHPLLTSGRHSNGFVDVGKFLKDHPDERVKFASFILTSLEEKWGGRFTHVVGADTSSTELAMDVAKIANVQHIRMIKAEDKRQIWHLDNESLKDHHTILHLEVRQTIVKMKQGSPVPVLVF